MNKASVTIVNVNAAERRMLHHAMENQGYSVTDASDASDLCDGRGPQPPSAILLDLDDPDHRGLTMIPTLRSRPQTAILAISSEHEPSAKIAALDLGADDYVTKPFVIDELFARLRAALRHVTRQTVSFDVIEIGTVKIDIGQRQVRRSGELVHLTRKEYDVLTTLAAAPGRVMTHQQLLERAWPLSPKLRVEYLRIVIRSLRLKLEADPAHPGLILNELGIGYKLGAKG